MTTDTLELPEPIARVRRWTTNSVTVDIDPAMLSVLPDGMALYSVDQISTADIARRLAIEGRELPDGDVPIWGAPDKEQRDEVVRRLYSAEFVRELLAQERERCAQIVENGMDFGEKSINWRAEEHVIYEVLEAVASAIRNKE